jgi:hypothetical protein
MRICVVVVKDLFLFLLDLTINLESLDLLSFVTWVPATVRLLKRTWYGRYVRSNLPSTSLSRELVVYLPVLSS